MTAGVLFVTSQSVELENILRSRSGDISLLIGNGIHLHSGANKNSWASLLGELAVRYELGIDHVPKGASATEFFDVLDLHARGRSGELGKAFCSFMRGWQVADHHRRIMEWAVRHDVPVLTTNFDEVLSRAIGAELMRPKVKGFTDFYPWDSRYAHKLLEDPCAGFGIWHVNGTARYSRSIRLGLTHYMGAVQRARAWFHRGDGRLFESKDRVAWPGRRTWLHLIFNKPLLIFGLGLGEDEVFLRWLLIERARYFAKFPERHRDAWYVSPTVPGDPAAAGRKFFLEGVGIRCLEVAEYTQIYDLDAWGA